MKLQLQWEMVESTRSRIPSWRQDLLPPPYDFSLMSAIQKFSQETPQINELFLDRRQVLETGLNDLEEVVLWSGSCIVRNTKNGIKQSRKDREKEDWEDESNMDRLSTNRGSKIDQTKLVTLEIEYVKDVDPDIVSVARNRFEQKCGITMIEDWVSWLGESVFVVGWNAGVLLLPV